MATHKIFADLDVDGEVQGTSLDINGNGDISGSLTLAEYIYHSGDTTNYHRFLSNRQTFIVGNSQSIDLNNGVSTFGHTGGVTTLQGSSLTLTGAATFNSSISATSGTFSGDINANGNIVGDDGTRITNINTIGCDILHADAESLTKFTMGSSEIACTVEDTDVFQVTDSDFTFDPATKVSIHKRNFAKTSNTDADADGDIVYFGSTTSMDAGKIYYYTSGGAWALADADAESTAKGMLGVALGSASDTNGVLIRGMVTLDHDPGTIGDTVFLSTTAGQASSTAPSGNGDIVRVIGYCLDSTNGQIYFNPDGTFVEVTA